MGISDWRSDVCSVDLVSPKCELSFSDDEADGVLTEQAGTTTLPFAVDCNERMNVQMRSLNGGLQHVEVGREPRFNGFANFVPYTATFRIDAEGARGVSAESREMTSPVRGSRSEERRVGTEGGSQCRSRWSPDH